MTPTIKPLPKQDEAWTILQDSKTKYLLFGGGAGGGKSWLGAEWLMVMCYMHPGTKWFIGRKELKRLMQSSYVTFQKVCKLHSIPDTDWKLNGQYNYIEFKNGSRIDLLDLSFQPSDQLYERFGSTEYTGGWIEEAGEVDFRAFDVLKTRIGRHLNKEYNLKAKMLLTANPKKNWLKRLIWKPWKEKRLDAKYAYIQSLYSDNKYTAEDYGETLAEISDNANRQRLEKGNWDYDDDVNSLVEGAAITDIWTNIIEEDVNLYATLDVARHGKDFSVMKVWQGFKVIEIHKWSKQGIDVTADKAEVVMKDRRIPRSRLIIDEDGIGGGVLDLMKGANGFIANSSPMERPGAPIVRIMRNGKMQSASQRENFKTLKDQCGFILAEMINNRKIAIDCNDEVIKEVIEEEISELKEKDPDKEDKKRLVPKEDIKENIGRSPDYLDNLIMRMHFELTRPLNTNQNFKTTNKTIFK